jgi:hypothetical protein
VVSHLKSGAIQTDVFGLPATKCRNAASGERLNTINLGNALGKFKLKISPEGRNIFCDSAQEDQIIAPFQG